MTDFAIIFGAALVGGIFAYFLKQPMLIGYLLAGIAIGPNAFGLVNDLGLVETMASIGVVLLMFTIGMEFSLGELKRVGRVGVSAGIIQILATALIGYAIASRMFHWGSNDAIFFGFLTALTSTMIVLKILVERGETSAPHGKILIAILLIQDLSVLPLMVVLPSLGQPDLLYNLGLTLGRAVLVLGAIALVGFWVIPRILGQVAGTRSREIFMIAVLAIGLGTAFSTTYFGVSAAFGAFAAGMMIGRSHFSHQALAEIIPLRNGFAALFFVSLGMLTSPRFVVDNWREVALVTAVIVLVKSVGSSIITKSLGYGIKTVLFVGVGLIPVGEFSFILARAGLDSGVVSDHLYSLILASAMFTILLTPLLLNLAGKGYGWVSKSRRLASLASPGAEVALDEVRQKMVGHVVICGYGRVGSNLAATLQQYRVPYLVVEVNPQIAAEVRAAGTLCIYGDAGNPHILALANIETAKVLAVTCPDPMALAAAVSYALRVNREIITLARAVDPLVNERLEKLGVTQLVEPEFEASLEFVRHTLQSYAVDSAEVDKLVCLDLRQIARDERKRKSQG